MLREVCGNDYDKTFQIPCRARHILSTASSESSTPGLLEAKRRGKDHVDRPLWPWSRMTAWRHVTAVMATAADIPAGPHRSPKGLHHGFGVHAISRASRSTCPANGWATPRSR